MATHSYITITLYPKLPHITITHPVLIIQVRIYYYFSPLSTNYVLIGGSQVLTVSQQPRFTAPMIYTYTLPHRSHRSHRSRGHHRMSYYLHDDECCGCSDNRGWPSYGIRYGHNNEGCGCCGNRRVTKNKFHSVLYNS